MSTPSSFRIAVLSITVLVGACTYGEAEERASFQNFRVKPKSNVVATIVKYEKYRPATGLSTFPDGGVSRMLAQRADIYVLDVSARTILRRVELPGPAQHRLSFSPWVLGWSGDDLFLQITGCPGRDGSECWGPLVQKSIFRLSPNGQLSAVPAAPLMGSGAYESDESYLDASFYFEDARHPNYATGYVKVARQRGGPYVPVFRWSESRLTPITPQ